MLIKQLFKVRLAPRQKNANNTRSKIILQKLSQGRILNLQMHILETYFIFFQTLKPLTNILLIIYSASIDSREPDITPQDATAQDGTERYGTIQYFL